MYEASELILNQDGSVFHLHLKPEQLSDKVILVGDRARTDVIASYFDSIECEVQNREFRTITGMYRNKRISVLSTGIGCGNLDIVMNELDALVNIDLEKRVNKDVFKKLTLVRVGTSGGLQANVPEGTFVASKRSIGFDGVINFYADSTKICDMQFEKAFVDYTNFSKRHAAPYCVKNSENLLTRIASTDMVWGNTIASSGFYGPQGRILRLNLDDANLNKKIMQFEFNGEKITNYEMEGSVLAGMSALMGHEALTVCLIIANRYGKSFIGDYSQKMKELISLVLDRI